MLTSRLIFPSIAVVLATGCTGAPKKTAADVKAEVDAQRCDRAHAAWTDLELEKSTELPDEAQAWSKLQIRFLRASARGTLSDAKSCGVDTNQMYERWMNFLDTSIERLRRDSAWQVEANAILTAVATSPMGQGPSEFFNDGLVKRIDQATRAHWTKHLEKNAKLPSIAEAKKTGLCVFGAAPLQGKIRGESLRTAWADSAKDVYVRCALPESMKGFARGKPDDVVLSRLDYNLDTGETEHVEITTLKGVVAIGEREVTFRVPANVIFKQQPGIAFGRWVGFEVDYRTHAKGEGAAKTRAKGVFLMRRG